MISEKTRSRASVARTIEAFRQQEKTTIGFACHLLGMDRQVYYRSVRRGVIKQDKVGQVVTLVHEIRKSIPELELRNYTIF